MKKMLSVLVLACSISLAGLSSDTIKIAPSGYPLSPATLDQIMSEGLQKSQVMRFAWYLTDVSGPRLTVSSGIRRAQDWIVSELKKAGFSNVRKEAWGTFGRGWDQEKCYIAMTAPYYSPLIGQPKAFTGGTGGAISGEVILVDAADSAEFVAKYKGKLKGKIVLQNVNDTLTPSLTADGNRYSDEDLAKMAAAKPATAGGGRNFSRNDMAARFQRMMASRRVGQLMAAEEPLLILDRSSLSTDGTVFLSGGGSFDDKQPVPTASVMLSTDDYLRIQRLISNGISVRVDAEVKTKILTDDLQGYNIIAEIPGSDPVLKNEIVMLGAHLDSWTGATGATDNAAGSAAMLEAMRIIKTLDEKPKRTIRLALWSGEEQGLYGSRNWVKNNLADPADMKLLPQHEKISAYYNLDNGSGKIRGIYTQQNESVVPIFTEWLIPFHEHGAKTVTLNNTGGTDHLAFDAVGVPGFQFIQDELEYNTRTHHTNMDNYDHLVPDDLRQAATIIATFVMNTAQRSEKIPRKTLPEPRGAAGSR